MGGKMISPFNKKNLWLNGENAFIGFEDINTLKSVRISVKDAVWTEMLIDKINQLVDKINELEGKINGQP
jgi:hypothetical protein